MAMGRCRRRLVRGDYKLSHAAVMSSAEQPAERAQEEPAIVAQGAHEPLEEMREALERSGVSAEILRPPGKPDGGWGTQFWLAVASQDRERARHVLRSYWAGDLDSRVVEAAEREVDLDAEQAVCPACQASFQPQSGQCPECGLRLG